MRNKLRSEVIAVYKHLSYLGREYPKGEDWFKPRLKNGFMKNKDVQDPEEIKKLIARADFVAKELEALYALRKYRALKDRYHDESPYSIFEDFDKEHGSGGGK